MLGKQFKVGFVFLKVSEWGGGELNSSYLSMDRRVKGRALSKLLPGSHEMPTVLS